MRLAYAVSAIALFLCPLVAATHAYACAGLIADHTPITTAAEFDAIRSTAHQATIDGVTRTVIDGRYFICNDIDLDGMPFVPMNAVFIGSLRGPSTRVVKIRNLTISQLTLLNGSVVGLFKELGSGAQIRSLTFENFSVTGRGYVGLLAAYAIGSTIIDDITITSSSASAACQVSALHSSITSGGTAAGLLFGLLHQSGGGTPKVSRITISPFIGGSCRVEATRGKAGLIAAESKRAFLEQVRASHSEVRAYNIAGGLIGEVIPAGDIADITEIKDSRLEHVSVETIEGPSGYPCSASPDGTGALCARAGGVIGNSLGQISIERTAVVNGEVRSFYSAGGLIANVLASSGRASSIRDSFFRGGSIRQLDPTLLTPPAALLGGLAVQLNGQITHSYAAGQLTQLNAQGLRGGLIASPSALSVVSCPSTGACANYDSSIMGNLGADYGLPLSTPAMRTAPASASDPFGEWDPSIWIFQNGEYPELREIAVCRADFNRDGYVAVQDIFDFLYYYFNNLPEADFNGVGGVTIQDVFDYLVWYFIGC